MEVRIEKEMVTVEWYDVRFFCSHRLLGQAIDEFLEGSPLLGESGIDSENESWLHNRTLMFDEDRCFSGVKIKHNKHTSELIKFICKKSKTSYQCVEGYDVRLSNLDWKD